jgi:hypothetical protein
MHTIMSNGTPYLLPAIPIDGRLEAHRLHPMRSGQPDLPAMMPLPAPTFSRDILACLTLPAKLIVLFDQRLPSMLPVL